MSLFRQGKHDEARKLAIAAAAKMKPLPKDEQNPLANGAYYDDLILWLAAVAASIKEFGFRQPLVIDETGLIIVGHTRYKTALLLGLEEVPVPVARRPSPAQGK